MLASLRRLLFQSTHCSARKPCVPSSHDFGLDMWERGNVYDTRNALVLISILLASGGPSIVESPSTRIDLLRARAGTSAVPRVVNTQPAHVPARRSTEDLHVVWPILRQTRIQYT